MAYKILLTGGAGFVGSSLAIQLKEKYPTYSIFVLDNLKRRGSELNLPRLKAADIQFIHGDIRVKSDFDVMDNDFTHIIEASAEPSVLAGLDGTPDYLIDTNLNGTINCLSFAKRCNAAFVFLSTSRVYPIEKLESCHFTQQATRFVLSDNQNLSGVSSRGITEDFPLSGYRSLYGSTKLASELIIEEFNHFYNLKTVINRCGVIAGPWQMGKVDQGVVVLWMARHFWKQKLSYLGYGGEGLQVRDLLHVGDLFRLVDIQLHDMGRFNGQVFNVGGGNESSLSLVEMTELAREITGNTIPIEKVKDNRQADIRIYVTDNSKITTLANWRPEWAPRKILSDIFVWLQSNEMELKKILG